MKLAIIFFISFYFLGCNSRKTTTEVVDSSIINKDTSSQQIVTESIEGSKEKHKITGKVTYSNSYCGGARPTDEMLMQITAAKPNANATYYIRKGIINDVNKEIYKTVTTDENGNLNFRIDPGDYVIVEGSRKDSSYIKSLLKLYEKPSSSYSQADAECLNKWLSGYLFLLKVTDSDVDSVSWNHHTGCFYAGPCLQYIGPYPP